MEKSLIFLFHFCIFKIRSFGDILISTKFYTELYIYSSVSANIPTLILYTQVLAHRSMYTCIHYTHTFCLFPVFFHLGTYNWDEEILHTPAVKSDWGTACSCYVYTLLMQSSHAPITLLCFMLIWMKIFSAINLFSGGFKPACMKSVKSWY